MRTRYWGLYMYSPGSEPDSGWLLFAGSESGMRDYGEPSKLSPRKRFSSLSDAASWHDAKGLGPHVVPRPFYVTTKPRKLPPEAHALIDEACKFDNALGSQEVDTSGIEDIWSPFSYAVCVYKQWLLKR